MKRFRLFLTAAVLLSVIPVAYCGSGGMFIQPSRTFGGGGAAPFALETVANNWISSGTVTTSSMTFTCTSNTKILIVALGWRRNAGQGLVSARWNAPSIQTFTTLDDGGASMACALQYILNPTPGTYNIVANMSASVPGFAMSALSFTGASTTTTSGFITSGSVTTSTATQTTNVGDFMVGLLVKQDPTTSNPIKNTPGDTLQNDFTFGTTGNGGYFKLTTSTATTTPTTSNFSWTTAANRAHLGVRVGP